MFEKVADGKVDYVFLDLENAVVLEDKLKARIKIIEKLNEIDWQGKGEEDLNPHQRN